MKRILRWLGGFAGLLLVGALGSGLWEKVLSPLLSIASSALVSTISRFSRSYSDATYALAAQGSPTSAGLFADCLIVFASMIAVMFVTTPTLKRTFARVKELTERSSKARFILELNALLFMAALATVMVSLAKLTVAEDVGGRTLQSMEILRPVIGEQYYIRFRADFYSMKTERDFLALKKLIDEQAQRYKTSVPIDDRL